jgi:hypothetical protein
MDDFFKTEKYLFEKGNLILSKINYDIDFHKNQ